MKKHFDSLILFSFFFLITSILLGQTKFNSHLDNKKNVSSGIELSNNMEFEFGIRDELAVMSLNIENSYKKASFLPFNLHFIGGLTFLKYFNVNLKAGILFSPDLQPKEEGFYVGSDFGIFLKLNIFNSNFYSLAGVNFLISNDASENIGSHGTSPANILSENETITFYCLGLGYNLSRNFSIDFTYCKPNKQVFGKDKRTYYSNGIFTEESYDRIVYNLIKVGFQYSFIF